MLFGLKIYSHILRLVFLGLAFFCASHVWANEPIVEIQGDLPAPILELIFAVTGEVETPPRSVAQARRRLKAAAEASRSVLRSQGYYGATVEGQIIETISDMASNEAVTPKARLTILSGAQFTIDTTKANFSNTLPVEVSKKIETLGLKNGTPALAAEVVAAELRIINHLNNQGYPQARALDREAIVDHDTSTMKVTYNIDTGPRVRFGSIEQTGSAYIAKSWPKLIAPFDTEDIFDARKLNKLNARVIGTGVFDSSTAVLQDEGVQNADGTITKNILLNIEQGAINTVSTELGFSTTDGSGGTITYERRNFIGYAQTLTLTGTAKTNQIGLSVDYNIPFAWRVDRELDFRAEIAREDTDAFTGERAEGSVFLTQKMNDKFKLGLGLGLEASRFEENGEDVTAYLVDGIGRATYDNRNNIFDPEKGVFAEASLIPTYNFGEADGFFTAATLSGATYKRLSENIILAGRAKLGTLLTQNFSTIPLNRRFYAGGGGSVRGFGYQSISPTNDSGELTGGRSITETSLEVRYRGDSPFGFAAFVDAGSTSLAEYPKFEDVRIGAGLGVRYYTSFAPLRADIAIPVNKREGDNAVQVYISIGQSF